MVEAIDSVKARLGQERIAVREDPEQRNWRESTGRALGVGAGAWRAAACERVHAAQLDLAAIQRRITAPAAREPLE